MYARSHIDTVSGDRKYIYIDENNKKYIRDKNKYYPVKKYKGSYILQKIRGGASINVNLRVYGIKGVNDTEVKIFENIKLDNIGSDSSPDDINIISENTIYIFNKGNNKIEEILKKLNPNKNTETRENITNYNGNNKITELFKKLNSNKNTETPENITNYNHFVIIKKNDSEFDVHIKKNDKKENTYNIIESIKTKFNKSCYHIIYKRNNNIIDKSSEGLEDDFIVIFSISDLFLEKDKFGDDYSKRDQNEEYNTLYKSLIKTLFQLFNY